MDGFDRLTQRPTRTGSVTLTLAPDDAAKVIEAKSTLEAARKRLSGAPESPTLLAAVDQAQADYDKVRAEVVTFTVHLRGVGPRRAEELMQEHPPTDRQKARFRQLNPDVKGVLQWNDDTFPPALLAETIERITFSDDPDGTQTVTDLSASRMGELWAGRWSVLDRQAIFLSALALDQQGANVEALGEG